MPSATTIESFIARVEANDHVGAIGASYAAQASMQENLEPARVGRDHLMAHEQRVLDRARSVRSRCIHPVFVAGDLVVIR